jgi:hypothetical protein
MLNDAVMTSHPNAGPAEHEDTVLPVQNSIFIFRQPFCNTRVDLTKKSVDAVQGNAELWNSTAIFFTVDEGGGSYASGYVQPLDFFGDGTRIPLR